MVIRTARPYAAKAIIEHQFDVDHLNIWITFRFTMNINEKPANALWIVKVDGVEKPAATSAWQDLFTMLLTVDAIASIPDVVTVEYDGPSQLLTTTWAKQWEPWGPIQSSDSTLLPYGGFFGNEINWQQAAAIGVWYTISDVDISAGPQHKATFQNNQEVKLDVNGFYFAMYYITVECSIAQKHILTAFEINGAQQGFGQTHYFFARAGEEQSWSGCGLFNLVVDDVLSVAIVSADAGNPTLTVDHLGLALLEIGKAG